MFSKAYKLKSNNTLKNSEKKILGQRILDNFPSATEEKVKELVPTKSNASCMRLITHAGDTVAVYVVDGEPIVLDTGDRLFPALCALWKQPDLVPTITIHSLVLGKIQGGAPLYLPGVSIPTQGRGFPMFARGATLAVNTESNSAPAVIGTALMSSGDMLLHGNGVCLETIHVLGDFLCKDIRFNKITRPAWDPASYSPMDEQKLPDVSQLIIKHQIPTKEEWPELGSQRHRKPVEKEEPRVTPKEETKEDNPCEDLPPQTSNVEDPSGDSPEELNRSIDEKEDVCHIPEDMDGLLRWCLLSFLKMEGKKLNLPLKTNLLYKNHLMPLCPVGRTLDVKKSTYKKMGKFLEAMQKEGLIETKEIEKGVSALVNVNLNHPAVRAQTTSAAVIASETSAEVEKDYTPPVVRELYSVTAPTAAVLPPHKKGTALTASEARAAFTTYVRTRSLVDPADPRRLRLDEPLAKLLNVAPQSSALWEEVWGAVCGRMTASTELRYADGTTTLLKARMPPVAIAVATRSGNKKVTLVSNLEPYGFNLAALSRAWGTRAAAAVTVTQTASAPRPQLLLQGDQTYFVAKMLVEEYGLPKKFVEGADKALSKKRS